MRKNYWRGNTGGTAAQAFKFAGGILLVLFTFGVSYFLLHTSYAAEGNKIEEEKKRALTLGRELKTEEGRWEMLSSKESLRELMPFRGIEYVDPLPEQIASMKTAANGEWVISYNPKTQAALDRGLSVFEYVKSLRGSGGGRN